MDRPAPGDHTRYDLVRHKRVHQRSKALVRSIGVQSYDHAVVNVVHGARVRI